MLSSVVEMSEKEKVKKAGDWVAFVKQVVAETLAEKKAKGDTISMTDVLPDYGKVDYGVV
jgi:hypothetical protein